MTAPPSPPSRKPASATAEASGTGPAAASGTGSAAASGTGSAGASVAASVAAERTRRVRFRALVRASGGPRYTVALAVDAAGTGLLRPFLLLYGIRVLRLPPLTAGLAITAGVAAGLVCTLPMGRWLDRGARSTAVAAAMLVRVAGTALLLATPAASTGTGWLFAAAALFLGIGNQAFPVAHAALVATISHGRERDAALATGRSVRNAGLGLGALLATAALTGGTPALRALAGVTGLSYLLSAALAWSVRVRASPQHMPGRPGGAGGLARTAAVPRMRLLLAANVSYVFCLNVPEVALPLVLVTQLHASPAWAAGAFAANTVLVVAFQVPVTVWMSRFARRTALAISGIVISVSYLGFLAGMELGHGWAAPALVGVSVLCTFGEIIYAGSSTALVTATAPHEALGRALARFQLSTGFGLAISPAVITVLAAHGPVVLWAPLAAATLLSAAAVTRSRPRLLPRLGLGPGRVAGRGLGGVPRHRVRDLARGGLRPRGDHVPQVPEVLQVQIGGERVEQDRGLVACVSECVRRSRRDHHKRAGRCVVRILAYGEPRRACHDVEALVVASVPVPTAGSKRSVQVMACRGIAVQGGPVPCTVPSRDEHSYSGAGRGGPEY